MNTVRPCWGQSALFDSTDRDDHLRAKEFCKRCPVLDWCTGELERARSAATPGAGPQGTWAGVLLGGRVFVEVERPPKPDQRTFPCSHCGIQITAAATGRPPKFCTEACRTAARKDSQRRHDAKRRRANAA